MGKLLVVAVLAVCLFGTGWVLGAQQAAPPSADVTWDKPRTVVSNTRGRSIPTKIKIKRAQRGATYAITVKIVETTEGGQVTTLLAETRSVTVEKRP